MSFMVSAKIGAMDRLHRRNLIGSSRLSAGAMVGSADRPAVLKIAFLGDATALSGNAHTSMSCQLNW